MKEYMDKEATIESLNQLKPFVRGDSQKRLMRRVIREVSCIPAADVVERKRGEWHSEEVYGVVSLNGYVCSVCGGHNGRASNFCPHCGCDMRGEKHEAD